MALCSAEYRPIAVEIGVSVALTAALYVACWPISLLALPAPGIVAVATVKALGKDIRVTRTLVSLGS